MRLALIEPLELRLHLAAEDFVLPPGTPPLVRVAYLIPSNRLPQSDAVANLQAALPVMRQWYREAFARTHLPEKTFTLETLADGITPRVHVVHVPQTDTELRNSDTLLQWQNVNSAASDVGVPLFSPAQVWLVIAELHTQNADGTFAGNIALGASNGSGADGGVAQVGSQVLPFLDPAMLTDNRAYAGLIIPELGPNPLIQNVSFPSFEGQTLSSVASVKYGAALHELSHGFGLPHDFRNDRNFDGNLMGNGFRGFRGLIHPDRYPSDYAYLQYGHALAMNNSRYFNPAASVPDTAKPALAISDGGVANGQQRINFTASDPSGLKVAILQYRGESVAETPLSGTSANASISTPYFTAGESREFAVMVYDAYGNRQRQTLTLMPPAGGNFAPKPVINADLHTIGMGQQLTLDITASDDPNGNIAAATAEWDFDGDGTFELGPSPGRVFLTRFMQAGPRLIRLRLTDPAGAQSVSAPLPVRVLPEFRGGSETNEYYLRRSPDDPTKYQVFLGLTPSGAPYTGSLDESMPLAFFGGAGADTLTIDLSNGSPVPAGGLSFDGQTGPNNRLIVLGGSGADSFSIKPGLLTIDGVASVPLPNVERFTFDGRSGDDRLTVTEAMPTSPVFFGGTGNDTLEILAGKHSMTVDGGGGGGQFHLIVGAGAEAAIETGQHLASLTAGPGAKVSTVRNNAPVVTRSLSLEPSARLDITNNVLVVDYEPGQASPLQSVRAAIVSAYQAGAQTHWAGPGISSSDIASHGNHALGYAESADALGLTAQQTRAFGPETVDATAVLVRMTPIGDADLDGQVTFRDFQRLELGFADPESMWSRGDFDYDGQTDVVDFSALFTSLTAPPAALIVSAPGTQTPLRRRPAPSAPVFAAGPEIRKAPRPARRA